MEPPASEAHFTTVKDVACFWKSASAFWKGASAFEPDAIVQGWDRLAGVAGWARPLIVGAYLSTSNGSSPGMLMRASWIFVLALATSCGPSTREAAAPSPSQPSAPSDTSVPPPPARWIRAEGEARFNTWIGPTTAQGTLVVMSGRRAIVAPDGAVREEATLLPEPLEAAVEAIDRRGEPRLVASGAAGFYRLDDPLGAPVVLARAAGSSGFGTYLIGFTPGVIVVRGADEPAPHFLDLETGAPVPAPPLPALHLHSIAFRDARQGAAVVDGAGLVVTRDGGATWRAISDTRAHEIVRRGHALFAVAGSSLEGEIAEVDPVQATLGPYVSPFQRWLDEPLTLDWIRATRRDPLSLAVHAGALAADGSAIVAADGLLARVDLATGAVREVRKIAVPGVPDDGACTVRRAGDELWMLCEARRGPEAALVRVLAEGTAVETTSTRPSKGAQLVTAPRGGVLLDGPCNGRPGEGRFVCVRQRDAAANGRPPVDTWKDVPVRLDERSHAVGPLLDGRAVYVDDAGDPARLVAVDASGKETELASVPRAELDPHGGMEGRPEEDARGAVHFIHGAVYVVAPDRSLQSVPLDRTWRGVIRDGKGMAVDARGEGRVHLSRDGGVTWIEERAPSARPDELGPGDAAGAIGVQVGGALRVGWGPVGPPPVVPDLRGPELRIAPWPATPKRTLACDAKGAARSAPHDALATSTPPPSGTRRTTYRQDMGVGLAKVIFEVEGSERGAPRRWTIRWIDPLEIGGRPQVWSGAPRADLGWSVRLDTMVVRGARAALSARGEKRVALLWTNTAGSIVTDAREGDGSRGPDDDTYGPLAMGAAPGDPFAGVLSSGVDTWLPHGAPRPSVISLPSRVLVAVGSDSLLLIDWRAARLVGLPQGGSSAVASTLDGWRDLAAPGDAVLRPCSARDRGLALTWNATQGGFTAGSFRPNLAVTVDGSPRGIEEIHYDLRVTVPAAGAEGRLGGCVERMAVALHRSGVGAVTFVHVDFVRGRAEGDDDDAGGASVPMTCALVDG
jgi:hypothetical protein